MKTTIQLDAQALERFEVPVIRVGLDAKLMYANQAALALAGLDTYAGVEVATLLAEPQAWKVVEQRLEARAQGDAGAYPVRLARHGEKSVLVQVYAVPEVGPEGRVIGSIAFVTDEVDRQMHQAIERNRSGEDILHHVDELLNGLVTYDSMRVIAISKSREYLRQLYCTKSQPSSLRWWCMPPFVRAMIEEDEVKNIDVDELFRQPQFTQLKEDRETKKWLDEGFKHLLRIPVKRGNRTVAILNLESRRDQPFPKAAFETCARLPLSEAVLMALHYEDVKRRDVVIELIQDLAKGKADERAIGNRAASHENVHRSEIKRAADILVQKLANEFSWEHVSIFSYDEQTAGLVPLSQASQVGLELKSNFSIGSQEGLVGIAFTTQQTVNVGDVRKPPYNSIYREGVKDIISELCVPVPSSRPRWVVNLESKQENAFAQEEVETVELLVQEAGSILDRTALLEMRRAVLASIKDAVIETDRGGLIREANRAASSLLRVELEELPKCNLSDFFVDAMVRQAITLGESFSRVEASLRPASGPGLSVLISGALLPQDLGGKVFVISDLSYAKQIQQLDLINEVYRQAALESRVPLAIAVAGLRDLADSYPDLRASITKTLQQLRKVDLPLERLLHLASESQDNLEAAQLLDLADLVCSTLNELPELERRQVEVQLPRASAMVRAPRETLSFCLETMLSFALRTRPQNQKVHLHLVTKPTTNGGEDAEILVQGNWRPVISSPMSGGAGDRWRRRAIKDLALGDAVLKRVARKAGGEFHWDAEDILALGLSLPVIAKKEVGHG